MEINRVQNTNFKGIKQMPQEELTFNEEVQKMVQNLSARAEREVPEYGNFKEVFEIVPNKDKNARALGYALKIRKPLIKGDEKLRGLEAVVYDSRSDYMCERVIAKGSKEDILKVLQDKDLVNKLEVAYVELSKNLEDI